MNTSVSRRGRMRSVPTLLLAAMSPASVLAADGTLHFVGAIVASPYELTRAAAPAPRPVSAATKPHAEVVFERQWIDRPSASLAMQGAGAQGVELVFVDSLGRRRHAEGNGTIGIGRDGGRLSLKPLPSTGRERPATAALLTVSYD